MLITVTKIYNRHISRIIQYRNYKNFQDESFKPDLSNELLTIDSNNIEFFDFNSTFDLFLTSMQIKIKIMFEKVNITLLVPKRKNR